MKLRPLAKLTLTLKRQAVRLGQICVNRAVDLARGRRLVRLFAIGLALGLPAFSPMEAPRGTLVKSPRPGDFRVGITAARQLSSRQPDRRSACRSGSVG